MTYIRQMDKKLMCWKLEKWASIRIWFIAVHDKQKLVHLVWSHRRVTVAQIAEKLMLAMIERC